MAEATAATVSGQTSQTVGTGVTNPALTERKCKMLEKQGKFDLANFCRQLFGLSSTIPTSQTGPSASTAGGSQPPDNIESLSQRMSRQDKNLIQTLFSVEISIAKSVSKASDSVVGGISKAGDSLTGSIGKFSDSLDKILEPVSSAMGQGVAKLTGVLQSPLGAPFAIGEAMVSVVDKINPNFANKLDATFKKYKAEDLMNLPGQIYGSIRNLASLADAILALPFAILEDIYQGLMDIMQELSDFLDSIISAIFELIFDFLDSLLPIAEILEFLSVCGEVLSLAGGITGMFSGLTQVTSAVQTGLGFISQAQSTLSNPQQLLMSYLPPGVTGTISQGMSFIRNPQQLLDQLVPGDIMGQLKNIGNVPGLGFSGNLGYGLEGVFSTAKQGFITNILNEFEAQAGILKPLLGQGQNTNPLGGNQTSSTPAVENHPINNIPNVQGVPVAQNPPPVLTEKEATPNNENNSDSSQQFYTGRTQEAQDEVARAQSAFKQRTQPQNSVFGFY